MENKELFDKAIKDEKLYKQYKLEILRKISTVRKELDEVQEILLNEDMKDAEIAKYKFKESELLQKYNGLINSSKIYDLTLKEISLLKDVLEEKISIFERSEGLKEIKKEREKLDKENEFIYYRDEIQKIKNAIQMYKLGGDREKAEEYERKLNSTQIDYKYAEENYKDKNENKNENKEKTNLSTKENKNIENLSGYSFKQEGNIFLETQHQVLKDYSGNVLGNRVIYYKEDLEKGSKEIETIGNIENEDGNYAIKEVSIGVGEELTYQRKEMNSYSKLTGQKSQIVYQKYNNGNELYFSIRDGRTTMRIEKNNRGITIEAYNVDGELTDVFEYDKEGNALIPMGNIDKLNENYIQNCFDVQVPYFEAENKSIRKENVEKQVLESAIDATQTSTKTSDINKQAQTIRYFYNSRDQNYNHEKEQNEI